MLNIPRYRDISLIYRSDKTTVLRALREQDDLPVVLKLPSNEYPSSKDIRRYNWEFELLCSLAEIPHAIHGYNLERYEDKVFLVLEDFNGQSLQSLLPEYRFRLEETLSIGVQVAEFLAGIHARRIVHKDINPSNILYNPKTGEVRVIDFGIAGPVTGESPDLKQSCAVLGTLAYASPEQTGRISRQVGARSDLYC